jgi:flagellar hook-length control protein FliK
MPTSIGAATPDVVPTAKIQDFLATLEQARALPDAMTQTAGETLAATTGALTDNAQDATATLTTGDEDGNDLPAMDAALPDAALPDEDLLLALGLLPQDTAPTPAAPSEVPVTVIPTAAPTATSARTHEQASEAPVTVIPTATTITHTIASEGTEAAPPEDATTDATSHHGQRGSLREPGIPARQAAAPLVVPDKVQLPETVTERAGSLPTQAAFAQLLAVSAALEPERTATIPDATLTDPLAAAADATHPTLPFTLDGATAARAPAATATLRLDLPVTHPQWGEQLGERVQWLVQGERQDARLILNPPALGPLEVRIQVDQDKGTAQINFGAAHAVVRESLEAALPRLREMLGETGLTLTNVEVGTRDGQQTQNQGQGGEHQTTSRRWQGSGHAEDDTPRQRAPIRQGLGLVDDFA